MLKATRRDPLGHPVAVKEYRILTPEEYARLSAALPTDTARLFVDTLVESGLRWGEATELRVRDVHVPTGIVTVCRSVVEVFPEFHPTGGRFAVKPYPKSRRSRRLRLIPELVTALCEHAVEHGLGPDDLLFGLDLFAPPPRQGLADAADLGETEPNAAGRSYRHGTLSAYTAGRCRCVHCRGAFAEYRARRRDNGLDDPRPVRVRESGGHLPAQWFRDRFWKPACVAAGIDPPLRIHDLRHSHASWLLAGGSTIEEVGERLGHVSVVTTQKYVHTLPNADDNALAALDRVRVRNRLRGV